MLIFLKARQSGLSRYKRLLERRNGGDAAGMSVDDARFKAAAAGYTQPTPAQAISNNYRKPCITWNGLRIAIENPVGTIREGVDETGKPWRTEFKYAYGEVVGTEGADGDPVDVYMGGNEGASQVYIIRQMKRKKWDEFDEDKCFLGFNCMEDAKTAYLEHYDDQRFFGSIIAMPLDEFITKVKATAKQPGMLKSVLFLRRPASLS